MQPIVSTVVHAWNRTECADVTSFLRMKPYIPWPRLNERLRRSTRKKPEKP